MTKAKKEVLTEKNIEAIMQDMGYQNHCCNSYWPVEFARAIEQKILNKLAHENSQKENNK